MEHNPPSELDHVQQWLDRRLSNLSSTTETSDANHLLINRLHQIKPECLSEESLKLWREYEETMSNADQLQWLPPEIVDADFADTRIQILLGHWRALSELEKRYRHYDNSSTTQEAELADMLRESITAKSMEIARQIKQRFEEIHNTHISYRQIWGEANRYIPAETLQIYDGTPAVKHPDSRANVG